jgi:hypothetical protein
MIPPDVALTTVTCANCGAQVVDRFCGHCGQSRRQLDVSLWRLVREALAEIAGLDGRTVRTFRRLFLVPGAVTADYLSGRRRSYLPPVRLFVSAIGAFFFAFVLLRPLNARYYGYESISGEGYADAMTVMLILLLPVAALVLEILYATAHRPLVHHLIFGLYTGAAAGLWFLLLTLLAAGLKLWWGHYSAAPVWMPEFAYWLYLPGIAVVFAYLVAALRRVYGSGWIGSITRAAAVAFVMLVVFVVVVPRVLAVLT